MTLQPLSAEAAQIAAYWDEHIHDLEIARHPIGSPDFFLELDAYRFDKLHYLPKLIDFSAYQNKELLEIGCGVGIDLARFARSGADVTGIDLSARAIELARQNFQGQELAGKFEIMNGEKLSFEGKFFDMVYAHGVLQYTANPSQMAREAYRVLRPGGLAIFMMYNKNSWLYALSKATGTALEHIDAPFWRVTTMPAFRALLSPFDNIEIIPERFPVKTKLHTGAKAKLFNALFVSAFNLAPRRLTSPLGWHLVAFAKKSRK